MGRLVHLQRFSNFAPAPRVTRITLSSKAINRVEVHIGALCRRHVDIGGIVAQTADYQAGYKAGSSDGEKKRARYTSSPPDATPDFSAGYEEGFNDSRTSK